MDDRAVTTVEYALLLALVVLAGLAAWRSLGTTVANAVDDSTQTLALQ